MHFRKIMPIVIALGFLLFKLLSTEVYSTADLAIVLLLIIVVTHMIMSYELSHRADELSRRYTRILDQQEIFVRELHRVAYTTDSLVSSHQRTDDKIDKLIQVVLHE